jgi:predicted amidophosphoribosyltransferase
MSVRPLRLARAALLDALDLALPAECPGCGRPARLLCPTCRAALAGPGRLAWPQPAPPGLPPPWAVAAYDAEVRAAVIAHKERGRRALAGPLGEALANAARAALAGSGRRGPATSGHLALVPMPSRRAAVRERGHDPTLAITRAAAQSLRRDGLVVAVLPLLRLNRSVTDQSGLGAAARMANLAGAVRVLPAGQRLVADASRVLLVDDIITTGASLVAAAAALRHVGIAVDGAALVAATPRRTSRRGGVSSDAQ